MFSSSKRKCHNLFSFTQGWLPNKFRTLFYRSDIPDLVSQYDLVHIHNPIPALEMKRIAKACVARKIPYVVTTHGFTEVLGLGEAYKLGLLESIAGSFFISKPLSYVIQHAAKICCLAPQDQDLLLKRSVPSEKLVVTPNGVEDRCYEPPMPEDFQNVYEKWNLPANKDAKVPVCFFLANHTRNKGLDTLLEAFSASQHPYCLIVGGKKRDFDYDRYSRVSNNQQRILFTDMLSDREIHALHHYSDLFVFPSRADTLPLVVLEAMAAGRPVLSTRVGGIPFQIDDQCGRLVEPNDPNALRAAFEDLVSDRSRLAAMGQAALAKVRERFDWNHSAESTFEVYKKCIQDRDLAK